jgi:hypothetical protein
MFLTGQKRSGGQIRIGIFEDSITLEAGGSPFGFILTLNGILPASGGTYFAIYQTVFIFERTAGSAPGICPDARVSLFAQ